MLMWTSQSALTFPLHLAAQLKGQVCCRLDLSSSSFSSCILLSDECSTVSSGCTALLAISVLLQSRLILN